MTLLECTVQNCASNAQGRCCLPGIQVESPSCSSETDACCTSFRPQGSALANSLSQGLPQPACPIGCTVQSCAHNAQGRCAADQITVSGGPGQQARCAAFRPQ